MSKQTIHPTMLEVLPQLIVVNKKNNSCAGGGFASTSQGVDLDLTGIQWNTVDGASLTTIPNGGSSTSYTAIGDYGNPNSPINNPSSGVHNNDCFVTLPQGDYQVEVEIGTASSNMNSSLVHFSLYNLTDGSELLGLFSTNGGALRTERRGNFKISASKNISIRLYDRTAASVDITDLGQSRSGAQSGVEIVTDHITFTKIG
jgi:hypothetical protein